MIYLLIIFVVLIALCYFNRFNHAGRLRKDEQAEKRRERNKEMLDRALHTAGKNKASGTAPESGEKE